jgi:hypothetical protein
MWQKICRTDPKRASPQQYREVMKKRKRRRRKKKRLKNCIATPCIKML